jgi:hypothetical protein
MATSSRADEDVAGAIGKRGVEQHNVRLQRRQQHDRVVIAERIIEDFPVGPVSQHIRADEAAQGHEWHALLGGLKLRV